ncbi:MAG: hypothetical protein R3F46_03710 [bacterium]
MHPRTSIILSIASAVIFGGYGIFLLATRDSNDLGKKNPFDYLDYNRIQAAIDDLNEQLDQGSKPEWSCAKLGRLLVDYYEVRDNSVFSPRHVESLDENVVELLVRILESPPHETSELNELAAGELKDLFGILDQQQLSPVIPRLHALSTLEELHADQKAIVNECIANYAERFP